MENKENHHRMRDSADSANGKTQVRRLTASEQVDLEEEIREIEQDEQEGLEELQRR